MTSFLRDNSSNLGREREREKDKEWGKRRSLSEHLSLSVGLTHSAEISQSLLVSRCRIAHPVEAPSLFWHQDTSESSAPRPATFRGKKHRQAGKGMGTLLSTNEKETHTETDTHTKTLILSLSHSLHHSEVPVYLLPLVQLSLAVRQKLWERIITQLLS